MPQCQSRQMASRTKIPGSAGHATNSRASKARHIAHVAHVKRRCAYACTFGAPRHPLHGGHRPFAHIEDPWRSPACLQGMLNGTSGTSRTNVAQVESNKSHLARPIATRPLPSLAQLQGSGVFRRRHLPGTRPPEGVHRELTQCQSKSVPNVHAFN